MVIVLLDCSRSMHESPRGELPFGIMLRIVPAPRKIDAARQVLRECLVSAPLEETVVVLGFADRVVELARGCSIDPVELEARISAAELGHGADIRAAFEAVTSRLHSDPGDRVGRVILISDEMLAGQPADDPGIDELSALGIPVDVVLLDPSPHALWIARRIASRGKLTAIATSERPRGAPLMFPMPTPSFPPPNAPGGGGLSEPHAPGAGGPSRPTAPLGGVASRPHAPGAGGPSRPTAPLSGVASRPNAPGGLSRSPPAVLERNWEAPIPRSLPVIPPGLRWSNPAYSLPAVHMAEDVAVTVAHAPRIVRGRWHSLGVFVHVASLEDEVRRIVRAEHGAAAARGSRSARLTRGTLVRIEPHIENAELDVEALSMRWWEDIQRAAFRFRAAIGATELRGSVDLYVKHALLCSVPISTVVIEAPQEAVAPCFASARMMESVFVSYATEERKIVERVIRPYRELGIAVLMDKDFLHVGDTTSESLRLHIERADVFQLFWSARSSKKPWVEREWRHAVTLAGPAGRKGPRFIRPLVWERRPPAWPPELAALQFGRLDLGWFARGSARLGMVAGMCLVAVLALVLALTGVAR